MTTVDATLPTAAVGPDHMLIRVPAEQVARGQPATVTVAVASGSKADLPDDEWLAAFQRTEGSLADLEIQRPEQPVIEPAPFLGF